MICPKCQFNNPDMAGFCQKCGTSLISGDIKIPQPGRPKKINPHLYAIPLWVGFAAIIVGGFLSEASRESPIGPLLLAGGGIGMIFAAIYGYIALFRSWSLIRGKTARTTPGKAVGFTFIPFYNLYWIFVAIKGLAEDVNSFFDQANVNVKRISVGLSLWTCIFFIASNVPVVGGFAALLMFIFTTILVYQWAEAVNSPALDEVYKRTDIVFKQTKTAGSGKVAIIIAVIFGGLFVAGILAAIAIPQFAAYKKMANEDLAQSQIRSMAVIMEAYYVDNGNYGDANGMGRTAQEPVLQKYGYIIEPNVIVTMPSSYKPCASGTEGKTCWSADAHHVDDKNAFTWNSAAGGAQW